MSSRIVRIAGLYFAWVTGLFVCTGYSQTTSQQRPRILGIAHVALDEGDVQKASSFFESLLGFAMPFSLNHPDGSPWISYVKINDEQYLELFVRSNTGRGQFDHFALYTDDLAGMQNYLIARHVKLEESIRTTRIGDALLSLRDPSGHLLEIVQYQSGSQTDGAKGQFLPPTRISDRITHLGFVTRSAVTDARFYREVMGFEPSSQGNSRAQQDSFAERVPDGSDYVEFLSPGKSGDHQPPRDFLCLHSTDVPRTITVLKSRGLQHPDWDAGHFESAGVVLSDPSGYEIRITN